jgi:transmembrane sensor
LTRPFHIQPGEDPSETAAAAWLAREDAGWSSADEATLQTWLDAATVHREAYQAVCASMDFLGAHAEAPEIATLRRGVADRTRRDRRAVLAGALAATLALVVGFIAYQARPARLTTYETDRSTRHVVLADGSQVTLDAKTRLEVRLGRKARDLRLVQGQASFDVAHDASRPFSVRLGQEVVVATGTVFNLDQSMDASAITLIEGSVDVRRAEGGEVLARLTPGDQYLVHRGRGQVLQADPNAALAWRSGKIIFDNTTLAEAAVRIGRYAEGSLRVSPQVADLRLSGAFDSGDQDSFLRAVEAYLPVRAVRGADGVVELRPPVS